MVCARVLRWLWEKHSATEKSLGLPVSEAQPAHVRDVLQPCKYCDNEAAFCKFFLRVEEGGGEEDEEDEAGLDD
eukprot:11214451-Lingulodinium_polyedra.AAC.1